MSGFLTSTASILIIKVVIGEWVVGPHSVMKEHNPPTWI